MKFPLRGRRAVVPALIVLALPAVATPAAARGSAMPRITVHGSRLYAGARPFRPWGMNWGVADREPVVDYFDAPTAGRLATLRVQLAAAQALGANSMRVYLQLGQVMATPTRPRPRTLLALQRLLAVAQSDRVYLDITGDLVWRPADVPAWYGRLPVWARWRVQARFWEAVAGAASDSPAVLCYELTSEPIVAPTPGYYHGELGGWWFVQSIATASRARGAGLARAWTRQLAGAVRSRDNRPVSIGLLPDTAGPFAPANVAGLLDLLVVHEYPATGQAGSAIGVVRAFAAYRKPVLVGETAMMFDDAATQTGFLTGVARYVNGVFGFFDGRAPDDVAPTTIGDALYAQNLSEFVAVRRALV